MTNGIKTYHGQRLGAGHVRVWTSDRRQGTLIQKDLQHYSMHSPDGFEWGYPGSGPADLALAILIDHLGETPTKSALTNGRSLGWHLHQAFKSTFVASFGPTWEISGKEVQEWLDRPEIALRIAEYRQLWDEIAQIEAANGIESREVEA